MQLWSRRSSSRVTSMSPEEISEDDMVIAFMGPTGTGKSTFIDLLTGQEGTRAGNHLESVTQGVDAICVLHPLNGKRIILVDTPGFDDTYMTELEILKLIADWLKKTYKRNMRLGGIIYLHSIADRRMKGSTLKNLHIFRLLCGDFAMKRIVLTTTMWEDIKIEDGERREAQLKSEFWQQMIHQGATVDRLMIANRDEAWRVINRLIERCGESCEDMVRLEIELGELERKLKVPEGEMAVTSSLHEILSQEQTRNMMRGTQGNSQDWTRLEQVDAKLRELEDRISNIGERPSRMSTEPKGPGPVTTILTDANAVPPLVAHTAPPQATPTAPPAKAAHSKASSREMAEAGPAVPGGMTLPLRNSDQNQASERWWHWRWLSPAPEGEWLVRWLWVLFEGRYLED